MAASRTILYFTVDPELRNRYKAAAALEGKSLKQWALEALQEKLEHSQGGENRLRKALLLADRLLPKVAAGTKGKADAAEAVSQARDERLQQLGA
jgi:hypothetical protein